MSYKYKPTFNKPSSFINPPKAAFTPTKEAPRENDPVNVTQIFDAATQGDISNIRNIIFNTNTPLNVKQSGETLIHRVILNPNIPNESDKLEIIKYLVEHEAGYSHNNFNVYPLHLACKFQYKDIVEYLLNVVDVNACDNNGMNALHYLVQGQIGTCPENKKIGKLVDDNKPNKIPTKELKKLGLEILDILNTNNFKNYFIHIKHCFAQLDIHYPDIYDVTKLNSDINNVLLQNNKDKKWKKNEIYNLTNNYVNKLKTDLIKTKFNNNNYDKTLFEQNLTDNGFINKLISNDDIQTITDNINQYTNKYVNGEDMLTKINNMSNDYNNKIMRLDNNVIYKVNRYFNEVSLNSIVNEEIPSINKFDPDVVTVINQLPYVTILAKGLGYYWGFIRLTFGDINNCVTYILQDFNNNSDKYGMYNNINLCLTTHLFNIMQYCVRIKHINDEIKKANKTLNLKIGNNPILLMQTNIDKDLINPSKIFDSCINIIKEINKIINFINIDTFNITVKKLTSSFNNDQVAPYGNIFIVNLKNINLINNFDEYLKMVNNKTIDEQRAYICETYYPRISQDYPLAYITNNGVASKGRRGYLINTMTDKNNQPIMNHIDIQYPIPFDEFTHTYNNQTIKFSKLNTIPNDIDNYYIGKVAFVDIGQQNVNKFTQIDVTPIGNKLNDYIKIIKLYVIKNIIPNISRATKQYFEDKIRNQRPTNLSNDDINKLYISYVVKVSNEIINTTIKNFIYESINNYVNNIQIINTNNIKITNNDIHFGFDLNTIDEDDIIDQTLYPIDMLTPINNPKKFQLNDITYNMSTIYTKEQCYKINVDIVDLLYKKFINMNKKDSTGSTPLFYALETNNSDLIKQLLKYDTVAAFGPTIKNQMGITPYKHFTNLYKIYLPKEANTIGDILKSLILPTLNEVKNNIGSKFNNNIIKSLDITFYQLIIMYNNMMFFYSKSYMNNWSYNDNELLKNVLFGVGNGIDRVNYKLPILNDFKKQIMEKSIDYNNVVVSKDKLIKKNESYDKKKQFLENIIKSLREEYDFYRGINGSNSYDNIINKITTKIDNVKNELDEINNKINTLENKSNITLNVNTDYGDILTNFREIKNDNDPENYIPYELISSQHTKLFDDLSTFYKTIYDKGICKKQKCNDYILYNELWDTLINDENKLDNITTIHLVITKYMNKITNDMNNINDNTTKNAKKIHDELIIIKKFYDSILVPTITRMNDDLPRYYDIQQNYVLTETLDIITHITKHTLCSNLYYTILRLLATYFNDSNINNRLKNSKLNNDLKTYILDKMPKMLVKDKLKIYEDDYEMDKINESMIFDKIVNIITTNTDFTITNDSSIMNNLNGKVFEYYKYLFGLVIPKMNVVIDNYNKLICIDRNFIDCCIVLNQKVMNM